MERANPIIQPSLGVCQQLNCSLNATNRCMGHMIALWNQCWALFHYKCNCIIKEGEELIKTAKETIDYLIQEIFDEGKRYRMNRYQMEFEDWVRDMKDKANRLNQRMQGIELDVYSIPTYSNQWRDIIKEIIESQAYQFICSYRFRFKIGNKLSKYFDDNEGIYTDNIMSQYHLKAAKEEQSIRENILMRLVKEITSMFDFFTNEYNTKLQMINDRITDESNSTHTRFLDIINKVENNNQYKFDDIYN